MSSRRQRKTEMITSKRGAELGSWFPWRNRKRKRENMALGEGSRLFQASSLGTVAGSLSMCPIENHLFIHSITQSINTKEYHSQVWPSYIPHAFSKHILCVIEPTFCLMRGEASLQVHELFFWFKDCHFHWFPICILLTPSADPFIFEGSRMVRALKSRLRGFP